MARASTPTGLFTAQNLGLEYSYPAVVERLRNDEIVIMREDDTSHLHLNTTEQSRSRQGRQKAIFVLKKRVSFTQSADDVHEL